MSTTGKQLMNDFGFSNFRDDAVRIARVLSSPIPIFIIAYDSRRPQTGITQSRINRVNTLNLYRGKDTNNELLTTPYLNLADFNGVANSYLWVLHDIAGYFAKDGMRESSEVYSNITYTIISEKTATGFTLRDLQIRGISPITKKSSKERRSIGNTGSEL